MAKTEKRLIATRLGEREIDVTKVISFPKGIIGFEHDTEFILLEIKEDMPFLLLQSLHSPHLGLFVADPYTFLPTFTGRIESAEKKILHATNEKELTILVTVSIPPGKPEDTALNLLGPIYINHEKRLGLQIPQTESNSPSKILVREIEQNMR